MQITIAPLALIAASLLPSAGAALIPPRPSG